jgi:hypothetical protein
MVDIGMVEQERSENRCTVVVNISTKSPTRSAAFDTPEIRKKRLNNFGRSERVYASQGPPNLKHHQTSAREGMIK